MKSIVLCSILFLAGCAHEAQTARAPQADPPPPTPMPKLAATPPARAEQIRTECVRGRRLICGRVLEIDPNGLVVDSGYTDLLRPPLTESWVVPGTAVATKNPTVLELNEPGTACIGLAFLTDLPRRPKVNNNDYVILMGYPAGEHVYSPAPGIERVIRKFSGGLETAVRLRLQAEAAGSNTNSPTQ